MILKQKTPYTVILVWLLFMINACTSIFTLPLWGGFDEWLHYSYIAYLCRSKKIPLHSVVSVPKEVQDSLSMVPTISWEPYLQFKEFWDEPESERLQKISNLRLLKNDFNSPYPIGNWQSQHPPLYYILLSPVYSLLNGKSLLFSVKILRLLSVLIASLALFPMYYLFRMFFEESESVLALTLFTIYPATFILFGHLSNDCLALPIFVSLILVALYQFRDGITLKFSFLTGILVGLGLLTKLYILTAVPVILFIYFYRLTKEKEKRIYIFNCFFAMLICAILISSPWFLNNIKHYGTWNPTVHAFQTREMGFSEKLQAPFLVNWKSFFTSMLIGMLWSGNWSFLSFPNIVYKIFDISLFLIFIGYIVWIIKQKDERKSLSLVLLLFSITFLLALVQHQFQIRLAGSLDTPGGWYWTVLLPTHIILSLLTIQFISGKYFSKILFLILFCTYGITLWSNLGILLPYYAGYLEKIDITSNFINSFPLMESFERIALLNSVSFAIIIFQILSPICFLSIILLISRNLSSNS